MLLYVSFAINIILAIAIMILIGAASNAWNEVQAIKTNFHAAHNDVEYLQESNHQLRVLLEKAKEEIAVMDARGWDKDQEVIDEIEQNNGDNQV